MLIMTTTKLFGILVIVLLLVLTVKPSGADNPCDDHAQTILDALNQTSTVTGGPVPVYRYGNNDVLYCMVTTSDQYVLIDVTIEPGETVLMGDLPSPIAELDEKANNKCVKYFLCSSGGLFICETEAGVVGLEKCNTKKNNKMWKRYDSPEARGNPENKSISERDSDEKELKFKLDLGAKGKSGNENLDVDLNEIVPGQSRNIAVGNKDNVDKIEILSNADLSKTCDAIENCVISDGQASIPNSEIVTEPASLHKIVFTLKSNAKTILDDVEAVITVVIKKKDGSNTLYVMQVQYPPEGKGTTTYTNWSSWRYRWRVPYLGDFPRYRAHYWGSCWRTYASVAWASVFGFFDRRAFRGGHHSRCHSLVRSRYDGIYGGTLKAPYSTDSRMKWYMYRLSQVMGDHCYPTSYTRLTRVWGFYRDRMSGWRGMNWILNGNTYHGNVANFIWNYSYSGWPVVTAVWWGTYWREGVVVATAYKYRRYRTCTCLWGICICGSWHTQYHKIMYFYRGDGTFRWYTLKAANAWVARY